MRSKQVKMAIALFQIRLLLVTCWLHCAVADRYLTHVWDLHNNYWQTARADSWNTTSYTHNRNLIVSSIAINVLANGSFDPATVEGPVGSKLRFLIYSNVSSIDSSVIHPCIFGPSFGWTRSYQKTTDAAVEVEIVNLDSHYFFLSALIDANICQSHKIFTYKPTLTVHRSQTCGTNLPASIGGCRSLTECRSGVHPNTGNIVSTGATSAATTRAQLPGIVTGTNLPTRSGIGSPGIPISPSVVNGCLRSLLSPSMLYTLSGSLLTILWAV